MFVVDEEKFARFEAGSSFTALAMIENCDMGAIEITIMDEQYWLVLSNIENQNNTLAGNLAVMLHDSTTSVEETEFPVDFTISAYPNPFNS